MAPENSGAISFVSNILAITHFNAIFYSHTPSATPTKQRFYRQNTKNIFPGGWPIHVTVLAMPFKLAFMTVGVMREPVGHPQVQGFMDRVANVYQAAYNSDGFHARSIRDLGTWLHSWGEVELPACFLDPPSNDQIAMTLSLWQDLESVAAFAYHGPHGEALTKRREWFEQSKFP